MNVAIVGSREFANAALVGAAIDQLVMKHGTALTIVSGGARGADSIAKEIAREQQIATLIFPADWDKFGRSAGYRRNEDIVRAADMLIAFYADGPLSRGTSHSVELARKKGIPVHVWHEGRWA